MTIPNLGAWNSLLQSEFTKPYFHDLQAKVAQAYQTTTVYPPQPQLYAAFNLTPPEAVRVVILGQDPYHEPNQANGLAFSVAEGNPLPPSLRNIYKELSDTYGTTPPNGDLQAWAKQGVFLLNTVLTVEEGKANSHQSYGWQTFTDAVIRATNQLPQPIIFILWGSQAQKKQALIQTAHPRKILTAPHPSPLSSYRGFFGSRPFSQANDYLLAQGEKPIQW